MIVDCFTFYNENEVLLLRLDYLYDVVDYFVIVESLDSFSKNIRKSEYMFEANIELYRKYLDKIRYYKIDTLPHAGGVGDSWPNEYYQRNYCEVGVKELGLGSEDWIIISDVDEIPRKEMIMQMITPEYKNKFVLFQFQQHLFYYHVNMLQEQIWSGTVAVQKKYFASMQQLRDQREVIHPAIHSFPDAGWHYSYMGGVERVTQKMYSTSEEESNSKFRTEENIKKSIETGKDLFDRTIEDARMWGWKVTRNPFEKRKIDIFETTSGIHWAPENIRQIIGLFPELYKN